MHKHDTQRGQYSGFTIVELIVVIVVLAILASVVTIGLRGYLSDSRDGQRDANTTTIVDALEKYYDRSGEYPLCSAVSASATTVSSNVLKGIDQAALLAPDAGSGETNSIRCSGTPGSGNNSDFFLYACSGSGACTNYTLTYYSESDDELVAKQSRRGN